MALTVGDRVQARAELRRPGLVFDEVVEEGTVGVVREVQPALFGLGADHYAVEFEDGTFMEGLRRDELDRQHGWL